MANSDFHKPKHIESWKTLLHCDKNPEAVKECIRENRHIAITFYRDDDEKRLAAEPRMRTVPAFAAPEPATCLVART